MFEADLNLRGGPKHKLAFTGVFTVKKHNWMLFGGISVQFLIVVGTSEAVNASCPGIILKHL